LPCSVFWRLAGAGLADNDADRTVAIDGEGETVGITDSSGTLDSPKTHVAVAANEMTLNVPSGDPVVLGDLSLCDAAFDFLT